MSKPTQGLCLTIEIGVRMPQNFSPSLIFPHYSIHSNDFHFILCFSAQSKHLIFSAGQDAVGAVKEDVALQHTPVFLRSKIPAMHHLKISRYIYYIIIFPTILECC